MADPEAIGGAVTGGLIASTFEAPSGKAGEHHAVCADCGTATVGRFCHNCGNPAHVHRTLLHLGEELLHGVMHFDSRTWRTLPLLLFRPGKLTRDWSHGMRARYVSPLAVFLFTVFVMFMLLSYMPRPETTPAEREAIAAANLAKRTTQLEQARARLAAAVTHEARGEAEDDVSYAEKDVKDARAELAEIRAEAANPVDWKEKLAADAKAGKVTVNTGNKALDEKVLHKLENPDLAIYKLQQTFYKFSFLLVPISIPFVAVLFLWKRGLTLYDHGVFVLYSLAFVSLLVMALAFAARAGGAVEGFAFALAPFLIPAHMFAQLKGAYGLGVFSAAWRTMLLLLFSAVALALFVLAIVWLGLA